MSSFTPLFPPVILEKCLDLAKLITENKTGRANLKINLGNSSFDFSFENSTSKALTGTTGMARKLKKKSPSDRRRDILRKQQFLEKKRNSCPDNSSPSTASSTNVPADPATQEHPRNAEASNSLDNLEEFTEAEVPDPVENTTRNMEVDVPSPISPLSPSPIQNRPYVPPNTFIINLNKDKKDLPPDLFENHIDEMIPITVILNGNRKTTESSLRRTLTKCNLRSIEPKVHSNQQDYLFSPNNQKDKAQSLFTIVLRKTNLQNTLKNILINWIPVEGTNDPWFRASIGEKIYLMSRRRDGTP